ncbi:MAG TPA: alkaline phosphatase family protein [Algoriphagus sp.]|nr:alkaline phosphatase family protein [Algoriphagus sp.]
MSTFLISRSNSTSTYQIWNFNPEQKEEFSPVPIAANAAFDPGFQLAPIGGYLLAWGPSQAGDKGSFFPYRLFEFDPNSQDPLAGKPIQQGNWPITKFWGYRGHYSDNPNEQKSLPLISMGNFMLFFIAGEGRGTYMLYNFDPNFINPLTSDPLPATYTPQGGFPSIEAGHELICVGNYVLDRYGDGNDVKIWSFDPQNTVPLSIPEVWTGNWEGIDSRHQIVPVGDKILTWIPGKPTYSLWEFEPGAEVPFKKIVSRGTLPEEIVSSSTLMAVLTNDQNISAGDPQPGTIEFMRSKIKHVVYYTLESRSFDNVCGWLYEKSQADINFIGSTKPFEGASTKNFNKDGGKKVFQSKFQNGALSNDWDLSDQKQDPFHDNSDGLQQMFFNRYPGYPGQAIPDMGGFVRNNSSEDVMLTLTPQQLPVMNGLAENFAISDEWFCSIPGGTDINRAFAVSGSGMNRLDTWEGGSIYENWPQYPHRQSLWKVLWNNGIKDWAIYNSIVWSGHPFTYHLYLEGQVPSIDQNAMKFIGGVESFKIQAKYGTLPSFSFLEPVWIAPSGTSSYHPGASMVPGEITLNEIYEAIKTGPNWEDTLLVITFSKNGGIYDHVAPRYAAKPWPNDWVDGFEFDLLGPRVPTIMVSPWIKKNTVFRSGGPIPFDSTSFAATLLNWYGIPKSRWGMGDRMDQAPTFESVFQATEARTDKPVFDLPYDKGFPKKG